jgi:hypothetical protein
LGEIADLLRKKREEQGLGDESDKLLDLVNDIRSFQEDALIESLISNELLEGISSSVANLHKTFDAGVKSFVSALMSMRPVDDVVDETPLLPAGASNAITQLEPSEEAMKMNDLLTFEQETSLKQLTALESINDHLEEQARLAAADEFSEVGGVASVGGKPDASSGGVLESLSGFFKNKIPPLPKGIGKVFTGLKTIGKVLGKVAIVVGALIAFFDFWQGFTNEEELLRITGKSKDSLSGVERTFSGIANAIEGLTFGLLDAKSIFDASKPVMEGLQTAIDFLFDPETGALKDITNGLIKVVDLFQSGNIIDGLLEGGKFLLTLPFKVVTGIGEALFDFFDPSGSFFAKFGELFDQFASGDIIGGIEESFKSLINLPLNVFEAVTGKLSEFDFITDAVQAFVDFANIPINFIKELASKAGDIIFDLLPDSVKGFLGKRAKQAKQLGSFVSETASSAVESISNFFGSEDKPVVAGGIQKGQTEDQVVQSNADIIPVKVSEVSQVQAVSTPVTGDQTGLLRAITQPEASAARPVSTPIDNKSIELSKQRLEDKNITVQVPPSQPVVVQAPQPPKARVVRRTNVDDVGLSIIGAGLLDG